MQEDYKKLEDLFKNFPSAPHVKHFYDGFPIIFNHEWPLIGINCSGGADSTILAYLICKLIEDNEYDTKVVILHHIRWWETKPWQEYHGDITYNYLKDRFTNIIVSKYKNLVPPVLEPMHIELNGKTFLGGTLETVSFDKYMAKKLGLKAIYAGINRSPKSEELNNTPKYRIIDIENFENEQDAYRHVIYKYDYKKDPCWFISPISFLDKRWTFQQYKNLNLEDLMNMTRSCEGDLEKNPDIFAGIDYTTYKDGDPVPTCNTCYWCLEREWGYNNVFKK
jgi:7-cyano-7-deazaguanine synthase in queuosine biosynthesis